MVGRQEGFTEEATKFSVLGTVPYASAHSHSFRSRLEISPPFSGWEE